MWERAEVTVVNRVISVAPLDLQESTPIHSSDGGRTQAETRTPPPSASGRFPFYESHRDGVTASFFFPSLKKKDCCHLELFVCFLYERVFSRELPAGVLS